MKVHHVGMEVQNLENSIKFYQTFLGLHISQSFEFSDEKLVFMEGDGIRLELVSTNDEYSRPSTSHIAIQIDKLADWIMELQSKGYNPLEGPYSLENGWQTVFYKGPDGELIELLQENTIE